MLNKLVSGETPDKAIKFLARTLKSTLIISTSVAEASAVLHEQLTPEFSGV